MLTIGSALSKGWRSGPEAFRAGHYKDLTETGNRARKVSGTQGTEHSIVERILVFKRKIKAYFYLLKTFHLFGFVAEILVIRKL